MREFEYSFVKGLRKGLRKEATPPDRDPQLVECMNLRPMEFGLGSVVEITSATTRVVNWPFPQLLVGSGAIVVADRTELYKYSDGSLWVGGIAAGDVWDMADFGRQLLLTNGTNTVRRRGNTLAAEITALYPQVNSLCNYRGRAFGGGVTSAWYDCTEDYVIWSDIGSLLFTPDIKNTAGYIIMPFDGGVKKLLPLSDAVIAYGRDGIAALFHSDQYVGMKELARVGIPCKGAAGGGPQGHVFVDYNGYLWRVDPDGKLTKLGYQEYMSLMDASKIMVSYNAGEDEFYISDGDVGFVLTRWGLCQTFQLPTSVAFVDGELVGIFDELSDLEARVKTDVIDFGLRAFKTLTSIEVKATTNSQLYVKTDWKSDMTDTFNTSTWIPVNPRGFGVPIVTAVELRVGVKAASYVNFNVERVKVRIKISDLSGIRGMYSAGQESQ